MNHARQLHVHGPFQRAVHLGGNVVALRRLADDLEFLHRLHLGHAGGRVDVVARQRDVESLSADQFSVGDALGRIGLHRDHAVADRKLIDRHAEPRGSHLQQHPPRLGRDAPHGPAIPLDRRRTAGAALIDGDVRAAHDAGGLVVGDVQFIGHHLPEGRSGALAAVRLADVKGRGVVLMDDDPRIELPEVGVGIRTRARPRRFGRPPACERAGAGGAEAHDQQARALEEVPAGRRHIPLFERSSTCFGIVREGCHATTSFSAAARASAIIFAARLMAA